MQETLASHQEQISEGIRSVAKHNSMRHALSVVEKMAPKTAFQIKAFYNYMCILDNLSDDYPYALSARDIILEERQGLLPNNPLTPTQQKYLEEAFGLYPSQTQSILKRHLRTLMTGTLVDLRIRYTQIPLDQRKLKIRNFLSLWPAIAAFSVGVVNVEPKPTKRALELMDAWGNYDNISDLTEDLRNGLILVSQEDIKEYGLTFYPEENLPNKALTNYYRSKRKSIMSSLRKYSPSIFRVGIPLPLAAGFYFYFQTRQLSLLKPLVTEEGAKMEPPRDALNFLSVKNLS